MNKLTKFSRAIFAIAMMLIVAFPTLAHDFEVGGIYYKYLDKTAKTVEVSYKGSEYYSHSGEYTGSVTIPSSVTYGGTTYSVTSIGDRTFYYCTSVKSVTIANSVTKIGVAAFGGCYDLDSINIPNSVTEIGDGAFNQCNDLTSVIIPNSVTKIGNQAFYFCASLTSVSIPNSVISIGDGVFEKCSSLNEISIPNSITSIGSSTFSGCSSLTEITIPNSVSIIGSSAFSGTNLTEIIIPNSVIAIGANAFNCSNLQKVTSLNTMPQNIDANAFSTTAYTNAILTVPYKCNGLYAGRTGWGSFNNIVEMEMPKIYLTLKFPESGTITHKEIYEEAVDLSFKANEDWEINSITFNEEDVTAELDEDGNYTTPVLTADAILVVVFEKIDTSVEPISEKNDIKVYAYNGEVRIVGAEPQSEVSIYNSIGALVYKGYDKTIALDSNGVYILTVEGRTFKFAI